MPRVVLDLPHEADKHIVVDDLIVAFRGGQPTKVSKEMLEACLRMNERSGKILFREVREDEEVVSKKMKKKKTKQLTDDLEAEGMFQ
jgi:hypothetical protein